ncbi:Bifunctional NMN adenylyltransferase/Nudix hydrolase [Sedimentisphaera cyanobacteriorum]|uniref:Bifunctional NMN adenylyltransferase/Nudix hydrolase n=1 Tax=Sedimentisphaera cyanobacteriorum TaxID=1940790 RepID=A0A1Q2HS06_9BACT|nr:NUDIX hydrolase [Sedimentisphaera cyanobacteriorum]AQQ10237.1 Bifunctional NMN adenylyltransferase/Nudix hydrolase [Sedimentisphaera cyanobacteriorum]
MAEMGEYTYKWPRPMVTVDTLVFSDCNGELSVLLVRRGKAPFKDKWAVPGGFLEMDEDLLDGALRELEEETGLKLKTAEQFGVFGRPGRDPRGRTITICYIALIKAGRPEVQGADDAAEAQWIPAEKTGELDFAFDHDMIVKTALESLPELEKRLL